MNANTQPEKTEFNMAIATLKRIDDLLRAASYASVSKDANLWQSFLENVYREACPKFTKEEREELDKMMYDVNIAYRDHMHYNKHAPYSLKMDKYGKVLYYLHKYETHLRICMDRHGLLIPNAKSALWSMGGT